MLRRRLRTPRRAELFAMLKTAFKTTFKTPP
jgi:hypothetical protein